MFGYLLTKNWDLWKSKERSLDYESTELRVNFLAGNTLENFFNIEVIGMNQKDVAMLLKFVRLFREISFFSFLLIVRILPFMLFFKTLFSLLSLFFFLRFLLFFLSLFLDFILFFFLLFSPLSSIIFFLALSSSIFLFRSYKSSCILSFSSISIISFFSSILEHVKVKFIFFG